MSHDTPSAGQDPRLSNPEMAAVMAANPELTYFGFGIFDERNRRRQGVDVDAEFARLRAFMQDPIALEEFAACRAFLAPVVPTVRIASRIGSYGGKHVVEWWLRNGGFPLYICNGVFIAAALSLGFRGRRDGPNMWFNIGQKGWAAAKAQPIPDVVRSLARRRS